MEGVFEQEGRNNSQKMVYWDCFVVVTCLLRDCGRDAHSSQNPAGSKLFVSDHLFGHLAGEVGFVAAAVGEFLQAGQQVKRTKLCDPLFSGKRMNKCFQFFDSVF